MRERGAAAAYPSGNTPSKGNTPGPKGNSVLAELMRQAKARQQEQERGGAGSAPGSGSVSEGEVEAGEIQAGAGAGAGAAAGRDAAGGKRRYHSPIVWNPDGGRADGERPPKRPASGLGPGGAMGGGTAVDRAAEEIMAFRRRQAEEAELGYDPDGPPVMKGTPSGSEDEGDDHRRGGRGRQGHAEAEAAADRDGDQRRSRGPVSDLEDEEEEGQDAGRPRGGSRWLDAEAGTGAAAGANGAEERGRGGGSPSPRRAGSAAAAGGEAGSGRDTSVSRSPGDDGEGGGRGGGGSGRGDGESWSDDDDDQPLISAQIANLAECRSVDEYERLNRISEGTYGVVFRARCKKTGRICALKKIKMEKERDGFPVTSIREINILLNLHHPNIVNVAEVVMGSRLDQIFMVMEFMDHDLKSLMNDKSQMTRSFSVAEVKCLMLQLLSGIDYLHQNWVIHRDLKTSNILYNNRGELKTCDFGLARQYGSPLRPYTQPVVTLWYRPPELLLGATHYSTAVDMWSTGCIMAELLTGKPLFDGQGEIEQLDKICSVLGTPNEDVWPGIKQLPNWGKIVLRPQPSQLRSRFTSSFGSSATLTEAGFDLLSRLLAYDPAQRITAADAMEHKWFQESPFPQRRELMPTFRSNKDGVGPVRAAAVGGGSPPLNFMSAAAFKAGVGR
ncbi:hypothetical protein CHLRE_07g355400v5 [Chlamydomonas reinhardtii]|uniref:Protein kinase domain-containing protein n=1 Tax=Chlamydomonas reinhardtii TaxID=3055 RepID=A0A2K3DLM8_CHLRE|nr:uncharacterized protein CHLRE_07g355400v5 [Chlamydomonas reinhardtii]PNW81423.1 hypothetical protein CHLRE_07g355400v5 [Chlamydomonas reinhardtii]